MDILNQEETKDLKMISGVYWDKGRREKNQDSLIFQQVMTNKGRTVLAGVSDGIGGLEEGETASGYITERLVENLYEQMVRLINRRKGKQAVKRSLMRCFWSVNGELRRYGRGKEIKLGATISLIFIWGRNYVIFHLGDSRIYRWRRKKIQLLTKDHFDGGRGLTKCLGSFPFQYPDICFGRIYGKEGFLLCTDGFYRSLDEEMLQILQPGEIKNEGQIEKRLGELAGAGLKRGEQDNMTAVYFIASEREIA